MTVRELMKLLIDCEPYAMVTIGKGCGPLGTITPTVNGFVILDPVRPS